LTSTVSPPRFDFIVAKSVKDEIIEQIDRLDPPQQRRVLDFARDLNGRAETLGSATHELRADTQSPRECEMRWLRDHSAALRELAGKWIVLEKDRLVASDASYETARGIATDSGIARPFIIYIPETTDEAFMGL